MTTTKIIQAQPAAKDFMKRGSGAPVSPELKKIMEEESKLVKGRFKNYESPGGPLPLCCSKFPNQPVYKKTFQDGETYEVPLWVARHLNGIDVTAKELNGRIGSCSYAVHGFKWEAGKDLPGNELDGQGVPVPNTGIAKRVQRFGFESLEFGTGAA